MIIQPQDIDFRRLSDTNFEELCFDLLLRRGYEGLTWRKGGADSGRDIQGRLRVINPLLGTIDEQWFIECKRYTHGVPSDELHSKIAWADAEQPDHLLLIVSSHLTNGCREWLEKIRLQKPYRIHVIEGKSLVELLVQHQDVVERHCLDRFGKLLLDSKQRWLVHDLLPDHESLALLAESLDVSRLSIDDGVFLWSSAVLVVAQSEDVDERTPFSFDFLAPFLRKYANTSEPVLAEYKHLQLVDCSVGSNPLATVFSHEMGARFHSKDETSSTVLNYAFVYDSEGEGFEMCIEATGDFPIHVRHLTANAQEEFNSALSAIMGLTKRRELSKGV